MYHRPRNCRSVNSIGSVKHLRSSKFLIQDIARRLHCRRAFSKKIFNYLITMDVLTTVVGNIHNPEWSTRLNDYQIDNIYLDQWTAQKSRFMGKGESGTDYPIALKRQSQIADGDIVYLDPDNRRAAVLRLSLNPVLEIDLSKLKTESPEEIIRISVELGHAIGNQHWPAVVKGTKVYVPLTVDKKVMMSVMETHHIDDITYAFHEGTEVIPYMAPHEIRRLFGGASHESHSHDCDGHIVYADHDEHMHVHADGTVHCHH